MDDDSTARLVGYAYNLRELEMYVLLSCSLRFFVTFLNDEFLLVSVCVCFFIFDGEKDRGMMKFMFRIGEVKFLL